jgi:hypothetical protein
MKSAFSIILGLGLLATSPAYAAEPLQARVEVNGMAGTERNLGSTGFWIPLAQDTATGRVLYTDVRFMGDDADNREFNLGVGYRQYRPQWSGVVGGHIWLDRRHSETNNNFSQITLGGEWLGDVWDIRANAYVPISGGQKFETGNTAAGSGFVGNQVIINTSRIDEEKALHGLDLELGWRAAFMDDVTDSTRLYAGGYYFDDSGAENIAGWRVRATSDITNYLQLGTRFQRDDVRGSQGFLEATIRFPFSSKASYREQGVRSRLDERAERDIDIVSIKKTIDAGSNQTLVNVATGLTQRVIHVDNTAAGGGNGTAETPYNTLATASAASLANDIIYIHTGTGTTLNQNAGINLNKTGVMLLGDGSPLTFDGSKFGTSNGRSVSNNILVPAATTRPTISNAAGIGVTLNADNLTISGLTISGTTQSGIDGDNINNLTIDNVWINGSTTRSGIEITYTAGATYTAYINNIRSTGNFLHGIDIRSNGTSTANLTITNNYLAQNTQFGFFALFDGASQMKADFIKNDFFDNTRDGLRLTARGTSVMDSNIRNNTVSQNNEIGINLRAEDGLMKFQMVDNQVFNNTQIGTYVRLLTGNLTGMIQGNSFTGNGQNGIRFDDDHTAQMIVDMGGGTLGSTGGNTISGNTQPGVRVDLDGATLDAQYNWWGTAAGPLGGDTLLEDASGIDTSGFLTTAP